MVHMTHITDEKMSNLIQFSQDFHMTYRTQRKKKKLITKIENVCQNKFNLNVIRT